MFVLPKGYEKEVVKEDTKQEETEQLSFGKFCMKYKKFILSWFCTCLFCAYNYQ